MDDVYYMTGTKPKSDIILLRMDSGEAWFANAFVNGTPFKFLMDSGASKCVMSLKRFMSIPELFRPKLCITRIKFQVANCMTHSSLWADLGGTIMMDGVADLTLVLQNWTFHQRYIELGRYQARSNK